MLCASILAEFAPLGRGIAGTLLKAIYLPIAVSVAIDGS